MAIAPFGADPGSGRAPNAFWPPPQASRVTEDAPLADEALGETAERLERMLRGEGHLALRRYPIGARYEHGFVLTTRLERIHEDGSIVASSARWSDLYPAPANLRWLEGADALRLPGPGRYRALLVAFTDLPVVAKDRPSGWDSATLMESIDEPPPLPASRRVRARATGSSRSSTNTSRRAPTASAGAWGCGEACARHRSRLWSSP